MVCCEKTYTCNDFLHIRYDCRPLKSKRENKDTYMQDFITFDIETTRIKDIEHSVMYIWQVCIAGKFNVIGRTWEEFTVFINYLSSLCSNNEKFVCYVHNLSYEFQFLKGLYKIEDVLATDIRKIIKFTIKNIEFRCAYALSNMRLELFTLKGGAFHVKQTEETSGEKYDYEKERFSYTPLTKKELDYALFDVMGLYEAVYNKMQLFNDNLYTIPLTSTGYVRRDVKKAMYNCKKYDVLPIYPDYATYKMLRAAFRGGDTHANRHYTGKILDNVKSYDRVSSYPDVLLNCKFPISQFIVEHACVKRMNELIKIRHKAILCKIGIFNLECNEDMGCPYIAWDKCDKCIGSVRDNGRILKAEYVETTITDVDWEIIEKEYDFEEVIVLELKSANYGRLPINLKKVIRKYFIDKTSLKGNDEEKLLYDLTKALLNAIYGMMAQNPVKYPIIYDDLEKLLEYDKSVDLESILDEYKARAFVAYQWGVWCTAWARYRLHEIIQIAGSYFVYCDTDSVKVWGDIDKLVKKYNQLRIKDSKENDAYAKDCKGNIHYMGVYEVDGIYDRFCTLGAKKYCYEVDGKLKLTLAGVSKKDGAKELKKIENFKPGFVFSKSAGLEAVYNDNVDFVYTNQDGVKIRITDNVCLRPSTYTLGITAEYERILNYYKSYYVSPIDKSYIL